MYMYYRHSREKRMAGVVYVLIQHRREKKLFPLGKLFCKFPDILRVLKFANALITFKTLSEFDRGKERKKERLHQP